LYAAVRRPDRVHVNAFSLAGEEMTFEAEGHLARILQHENDHLDGVMFIDRLSDMARMDVRDEVEAFLTEFEQRREKGEIPSDAEITARIKELEAART
jgi:peptide deformylase